MPDVGQPDRTAAIAPLHEWRASDEVSPTAILDCRQPTVLRGLVEEWPAVACAQRGPAEVATYLERFDRGAPVELFVGEAAMDGRYFYDDEVTGFNFRRATAPFPQFLAALLAGESAPGARSVYAGSQPVRRLLPGFEGENPLPLMADKRTEPRIWIGNRSRVAPHFDEADNLACVVTGRRCFTLFPPDQVANLYIGPLDFTMAGQPASMVDLAAPDLHRYPRFAEALSHAFVAELEPGDAIFIPALWWHGVEASGGFNVLVNYWWQDASPDVSSAFAAMGHATMAIRELPADTRAAWRAYFDHFVFQLEGDPAAHLPSGRRGILDRPTPQLRASIRKFLLRILSNG